MNVEVFFAVNSIFHWFCAIFPYKIDENQLFQKFSKIIFFMICHKQNWDNDQFWWFLSLFCQETHYSDILRDLKFESIKMSILRDFVCNFVCFLWPHWVPCGVPRRVPHCWFSWKDIKSIQGVAFHDKYSQLPTEWMLKCFFAVNSIFH